YLCFACASDSGVSRLSPVGRQDTGLADLWRERMAVPAPMVVQTCVCGSLSAVLGKMGPKLCLFFDSLSFVRARPRSVRSPGFRTGNSTIQTDRAGLNSAS